MDERVVCCGGADVTALFKSSCLRRLHSERSAENGIKRISSVRFMDPPRLTCCDVSAASGMAECLNFEKPPSRVFAKG